MYATCDKNIPCGSRVMNVLLTGNVWTDGRTDRQTDSHSDYSTDPMVVKQEGKGKIAMANKFCNFCYN